MQETRDVPLTMLMLFAKVIPVRTPCLRHCTCTTSQKVEKLKQYNKLYHLKNKEKRSLYNKEYNLLNREKRQLLNKTYNIKNKEKVQAYNKLYRQQNIEKTDCYLRQSKGKRKMYYRHKLEKRYNTHNLAPPVPYRSWKTREEVQSFLEYLADKLQVKQPEDWYRTSIMQVVKLGGKFVRRTREDLKKEVKGRWEEGQAMGLIFQVVGCCTNSENFRKLCNLHILISLGTKTNFLRRARSPHRGSVPPLFCTSSSLCWCSRNRFWVFIPIQPLLVPFRIPFSISCSC
jgi:hypothetical protein